MSSSDKITLTLSQKQNITSSLYRLVLTRIFSLQDAVIRSVFCFIFFQTTDKLDSTIVTYTQY